MIVFLKSFLSRNSHIVQEYTVFTIDGCNPNIFKQILICAEQQKKMEKDKGKKNNGCHVNVLLRCTLILLFC